MPRIAPAASLGLEEWTGLRSDGPPPTATPYAETLWLERQPCVARWWKLRCPPSPAETQEYSRSLSGRPDGARHTPFLSIPPVRMVPEAVRGNPHARRLPPAQVSSPPEIPLVARASNDASIAAAPPKRIPSRAGPPAIPRDPWHASPGRFHEPLPARKYG